MKMVIFRRPFTLRGVDELFPAGAYTVERDEESEMNISFFASRRMPARLHMHGKPGSTALARVLRIDPNKLDAALRRDQALAEAPADLGAHRRAKQGRKACDRQAIERAENEGMTVYPG